MRPKFLFFCCFLAHHHVGGGTLNNSATFPLDMSYFRPVFDITIVVPVIKRAKRKALKELELLYNTNSIGIAKIVNLKGLTTLMCQKCTIVYIVLCAHLYYFMQIVSSKILNVELNSSLVFK